MTSANANAVFPSREGSSELRQWWIGILLATLGAIAFSGKAIIVKLAFTHGVDAITVVAWRMLFALPAFALIAWWGGRNLPRLTAEDWRDVAILGFVGGYLTCVLDFEGLAYITAGLERLLLYLTPTLVLLINVIFFKGTFQSERIVGLIISYLGVALVFGMELQNFGSNVWLGTTLCLGSAISYAIYLSYLGRVVKRIGVLRLAGLATTFACLLCIGHFLLVRPVSMLWVPLPVIGLSAINGLLCTFAPIVMTMLAIKRIGAPLASQSGMIGPVSTIALGVAFLGEVVTLWIMVGSLLVLGGVWLSTQKRKLPAVQPARP